MPAFLAFIDQSLFSRSFYYSFENSQKTKFALCKNLKNKKKKQFNRYFPLPDC